MRRTPTCLFMLVLVLAACASPGADEASSPGWVESPTTHPKAPAATHLAAVGRASAKDGDPRATAYANAVNQIAQTIEVQVQGVLESESKSLLVDGQSSSSERLTETVRLVAAQDLPGATLVDTWQDPRTGEFDALVAVPRELLVRSDLDALGREMEAATTSLQTADALGGSSLGRALTHRLEAYDALARGEAHGTRARTVAFGGPLQRPAEEQLQRLRQRLVAVEGDLLRSVAALHLSIVSGDDQEGHVGARLAEPLVARIDAADDDGTLHPVPDFPARFRFADGELAQLAASALLTDADGTLACSVTDLANTGRAANAVLFEPDLQRIAPAWPATRVPSLTFQYRLPTPGQTRILVVVDERYEDRPLDDGRLLSEVAGHLSRKGFAVQSSRPAGLAEGDDPLSMSVDALRERLAPSFDYVLRGTGNASKGDRMPPLQMFRLEASLEIVPLDAGRTRVVSSGEIKGGGNDDAPATAANALLRYALKPLLARLDADFCADFLSDGDAP
ncbi:MAG: LPP20 family lipoprotein [Planctomycetes bacterium]|nr:LPP20 family lipoprotein [Planctomycetota bacterium]